MDVISKLLHKYDYRKENIHFKFKIKSFCNKILICASGVKEIVT